MRWRREVSMVYSRWTLMGERERVTEAHKSKREKKQDQETK